MDYRPVPSRTASTAGPFLDPRDARIAELEASLAHTGEVLDGWREVFNARIAELAADNRRLRVVARWAREVRLQPPHAWGFSPAEQELWKALDALPPGTSVRRCPMARKRYHELEEQLSNEQDACLYWQNGCEKQQREIATWKARIAELEAEVARWREMTAADCMENDLVDLAKRRIERAKSAVLAYPDRVGEYQRMKDAWQALLDNRALEG